MQLPVLILSTLLTTALAAVPPYPRQSSGWTIRKFTRDCTNPNTCIYNFNIDTNDGSTPAPCTIVNTGNPATTQAWYGVACQQPNDWQISWGWDYQGDFTVMTTLNTASKLEAFFGYKSPNANSNATYSDNGPQAPQLV
ncbi:hypothetical protein BP6252_07367 [Coleophoma cylindrospora]|uniref:Surface protein 1 n=1 Tax=Coleophoma cylindrospora TaxID=1849047 RepID=A0A3D8RHK8_9HELO|nr:hypothetical protein BP6252_07367 [Coleophoma cylindrospora]